MSHVDLRNVSLNFIPKERKEKWSLLFGPSSSTGYDFVLLVENKLTKVSYQIEMGINPEGSLWGMVTPDNADNGRDAFILFDIKPFEARVSDNWGGPTVVIRQTVDGIVTEIENLSTAPPAGFV